MHAVVVAARRGVSPQQKCNESERKLVKKVIQQQLRVHVTITARLEKKILLCAFPFFSLRNRHNTWMDRLDHLLKMLW